MAGIGVGAVALFDDIRIKRNRIAAVISEDADSIYQVGVAVYRIGATTNLPTSPSRTCIDARKTGHPTDRQSGVEPGALVQTWYSVDNQIEFVIVEVLAVRANHFHLIRRYGVIAYTYEIRADRDYY